jgi:PAS domain S-box-containing protein
VNVWTPELEAMYGLKTGEFAGTQRAWEDFVHPDDRESAIAGVNHSLATGEQVEREFRVVWHDGTLRWLLGRWQMLRDHAGQPLRVTGINIDITERKKAEEELIQSQSRLRALATELNLAEQRERKRLAIELHDHLQQLLVLGKLKLGQGKRLAKPLPAMMDLIQQMDDVLSDALTYTRSLVAELSPPVLREHGLLAGVKWLAEWMQRHDLQVTVESQRDAVALPEEQALLLFQSVRELLINTAKHAKCHHASIEITQDDHALSISVKDRGVGFEKDSAAAPDDSDHTCALSV